MQTSRGAYRSNMLCFPAPSQLREIVSVTYKDLCFIYIKTIITLTLQDNIRISIITYNKKLGRKSLKETFILYFNWTHWVCLLFYLHVIWSWRDGTRCQSENEHHGLKFLMCSFKAGNFYIQQNFAHGNIIPPEHARSCCTRAVIYWKQVTKVLHFRIQEHSV